MRTVSQDISRDEQVHVGVNSLLATELNEATTNSLNRLRRATALWLFDGLTANADKWLDKDFWLQQSDSLYEKGKAPDMAESRASRMIAFFESPSTSQPSYGR